jgi:glycosyltransferase involved in cell wall biosynthesis
LKSVLKIFKPDIVHLNIFLTQLSPSILTVLDEIPVVFTAHWYKAICPKGTKLLPDNTSCTYRAGFACFQKKCLPLYLWWIDMLQMKLLKHYFNRIDFVIANSRITDTRLTADGINPDQMIYYFVRNSASESKTFSGRPTVCFVGRLVSVKGAEVLIRAMKNLLLRIPDARLLIAGEGPDKSILQKCVRELGLTQCIEFLGYVPNENLDSLWRVADVLAVPSLWEEPFGIVAAEALAAGVPVVATRGGGLEEILEDQRSGYLVDPGNAEQFMERLYDILRDRSAAERMGKYGREVMRTRFSLKSHLEELLAVYEKIVVENKNKSVRT